MKALIALVLLTSTFQISNASEATCEDSSYVLTIYDYDSSLKSCQSFIEEARRQKGCDRVQDKVSSLDVAELKNFSSRACIYNAEEGTYQVMTSTMAEPPTAVIMFSRWD